MLDKKENWVILLFEFKMGHITAETTCNIICKDKNLEDEECSGQPFQVDNDQLTAVSKADAQSGFSTREAVKELSQPFCGCSESEQIGKVKKLLLSGCLSSWPESQKNSYRKQQRTISHLYRYVQWKVDFIHPTTSDDQLSSWD